MNTAKLNLLACPAVLGFILLGPHLAHATEIAAKPTNSIAPAPAQPREIVFERPMSESAIVNSKAQQSEAAIDSYDCNCSNEPLKLNFDEQESKAAIERYGCDCAGCVNAVRQLQGKLPLL